jgi:SAM-dependent methyltransferase
MSMWYESWFDSPFYHQLYKDRDNVEAARFITNLVEYLNPLDTARFLDLACGKGRHCLQLYKLGLQVDGADYSENSINYASQFQNENLHFYKHDMREALPKTYNYILNLFTSFGYFETREEHLQTLKHIYNGLEPNGFFVFDFLNLTVVKNNLVANETVLKDGVNFSINRAIVNNQITKTISFENEGGKYVFKEKVMALSATDLLGMMEQVGFTLKDSFGNYSLQKFDEQQSKRLILILKK